MAPSLRNHAAFKAQRTVSCRRSVPRAAFATASSRHRNSRSGASSGAFRSRNCFSNSAQRTCHSLGARADALTIRATISTGAATVSICKSLCTGAARESGGNFTRGVIGFLDAGVDGTSETTKLSKSKIVEFIHAVNSSRFDSTTYSTQSASGRNASSGTLRGTNDSPRGSSQMSRSASFASNLATMSRRIGGCNLWPSGRNRFGSRQNGAYTDARSSCRIGDWPGLARSRIVERPSRSVATANASCAINRESFSSTKCWMRFSASSAMTQNSGGVVESPAVSLSGTRIGSSGVSRVSSFSPGSMEKVSNS